MSAPFFPPSTVDEVPEQMRRLYRGLDRLAQQPQIPADATLSETVAQVNTVLALIAQITRGADVGRR